MSFGKNKTYQLSLISGFTYLFLVGILGVALRSSIFIMLPIPFQNILHAHSHTALLGWAFIMSSVGILSYLKLDFSYYKKIFLSLTISILGMFFSFLYQGYGAISIGFSTLFVLSSYVFLYLVYQQLKKHHTSTSNLFQWGIIWYFVSTLGIWSVGAISAILGKDHALYQLSIQFFLHFQINGWLTFVAIGILLKNKEKVISNASILALNLSLLLTFALYVYWVKNNVILYACHAIGSIIQLYVYYRIISSLIQKIKINLKFVHVFYGLILIFLAGKPILQMLSVIPSWTIALENNRFLIIAFLHYILIGMVSFTFIYDMMIQRKNSFSIITSLGILLWLIGFMVTEIIIALQGFGMYQVWFYSWLLAFSVCMLVGIGMLLYQTLKF